MIQLKLTLDERDLLIETLESYISNLRYEIADTDSMDFRERLKTKEAMLKTVVNSLKQASNTDQ